MNKKRLPLAVWIFAGLLVGIVAGLLLMNATVAGMEGKVFASTYIKPWGDIFLNLLKFVVVPIVLFSIAAGVLLYLFKIPLPGPVLDTMDSMGNLMGPLCMLLAGMAIAESPLRQLICTTRYYLACALRLLVYPLAVLAVLWAVGAAGWIPDGKSVLMTVFLATITPACATITSMAQLYDCDVKKSSSLYVLSTLLSLITMPVMLGLFDTLL